MPNYNRDWSFKEELSGFIGKPKKRRLKKKKKRKKSKLTDFYQSDEWRRLRYRAIKLYGRKCMCCNRTAKDHGIVIHVDHIKPRSKFPRLELDIQNMQILCEDCNMGKSNVYYDDYRECKLTEEQRNHFNEIIRG